MAQQPSAVAVASAVTLPDLSPSPPPARTKKRPASTDPSSANSHDHGTTSPKRQRVSPSLVEAPDLRKDVRDDDDDDNTSQHARRAPPTTRIDDRDRKRNQRLFGALLSGGLNPPPSRSRRAPPLAAGTNTSNPGASAAAQRRQEAEARRRAEAARREAEFSEREARRLEGLGRARRREQRRVDGRVRGVRFAQMRALAGFLGTRTEPKLYYKPYEMTDDEKEQIARQVSDVEAQIDEELEELERAKQETRQDTGNDVQGEQDPKVINGGDEFVEPQSPPAMLDQTDQEGAETHASKSGVEPELGPEEQSHHRKESMDDSGDVVVEAEEDTVVY